MIIEDGRPLSAEEEALLAEVQVKCGTVYETTGFYSYRHNLKQK